MLEMASRIFYFRFTYHNDDFVEGMLLPNFACANVARRCESIA
jgi:hypothetical protein